MIMLQVPIQILTTQIQYRKVKDAVQVVILFYI